MARAVSTDFLQSMRFHVSLVKKTPIDYFSGSGAHGARAVETGVAGFTTCSIPDMSIEAVEYREGTFVYTRKFGGIPTVGDANLTRGVAPNDTGLWEWMRLAVEGGAEATYGEYRNEVLISQFSRSSAAAAANPTVNPPTTVWYQGATPPVAARSYQLNQAFPLRCKPAGDLDASAAEVSIQELDIACEYITVTELQDPPASP